MIWQTISCLWPNSLYGRPNNSIHDTTYPARRILRLNRTGQRSAICMDLARDPKAHRCPVGRIARATQPRLNQGSRLSLHDGSPLGDRSPSHCACSDTNGLRHKAQHQHQHIRLVLTHNVGLFNVIFNNVVNGLNVIIWGLS